MELDVSSIAFDFQRFGAIAAMLAVFFFAVPPSAVAASQSSGAPHTHAGQHRSSYATGVARDSHGRIKRSPQARRDFQRSHPCPSTGRPSGACPGYVVDHIRPLKRGGADASGNMQWQTVQAAKEKDKTE
jgi:hypothetical protein